MRERKRVLLAFSGGIDSCAAAESLRAQGYDVELLTIDMLGDQGSIDNAILRAQALSLPLHIADEKELFEREIIDTFTSEYLAGRTPAPCTRCNSLIKWSILTREADRRGIYHIATGHYFRVAKRDGLHYVARAADPRKDQSYYLWGVSEQTLQRVLTPMGERIKEEVKARSEIKVESMGICFLHGEHYADFLCSRCGELPEGDIVDGGEVVGRHNGIARYTIGQRRGEGIPAGRRVVGIEGGSNRLIVGSNEALYRRSFEIAECHFIDREEALAAENIEVMIRGIGRNPEGFARLAPTPDGVRVELLSGMAWAVAAGQPVALYIGERVIGGGYITNIE